MPDHLVILVCITAICSALVGGVFHAFSTFIMKALGQLENSNGIRAMQAINVTVFTPLFMGVFAGTALLCCAIGIFALLKTTGMPLFLLLVGAKLYIFGCIGVTGLGNVPLNERLQKTDASAPEAPAVWSDYLRRWTLLNHIRTIACLLASALMLAALFAPKA